MKILSSLAVLFLLSASLFATTAPDIVNTSIDSGVTQLTIHGSGFAPTNAAPTVVLGLGVAVDCQIFPGDNSCDYHSDPSTNTTVVSQGDTVYLVARSGNSFVQNFITWSVR